MSEPRDPVRLRNLDPQLRRAFEQALSERPSAATVDAIARAVERAAAGLPAPRSAPELGLPVASAKLAIVNSGAIKFAVITVISSGLLWAIYSGSAARSAERKANPAAPAPAQRAPAAAAKRASSPAAPELAHEPGASASSPETLASAQLPSLQAPAARVAWAAPADRAQVPPTRGPLPESAWLQPRTPSLARVAARRSAAAPSAPRQFDVPSDVQATKTPSSEESRSELGLLMEAQDALRASPARALALTDEHLQRYPYGSYAQEREQIAIEALYGLGDETAMRGRAARFARRYPKSPHLPHIVELLELAAGQHAPGAGSH